MTLKRHQLAGHAIREDEAGDQMSEASLGNLLRLSQNTVMMKL